MRIFQASVLAIAAAALAALPAAIAQADETPELKVTTTFPGNPLSLVKNGQANVVVFNIQNPPGQDRVLELTGITGGWLDTKKSDGQRGRVLRNMTTTPYKSLSLKTAGGSPLEVPYNFYPEFKPQNLGVEFRLLIRDAQTSKIHNVQAYQGTVTVIEPPKSLLDIQLISVYLIVLAALGAVGYFAYLTYGPKQPAPKAGKGKASQGSASAALAQAAQSSSVNAKGYDESWIPEHHMKAKKRSTK